MKATTPTLRFIDQNIVRCELESFAIIRSNKLLRCLVNTTNNDVAIVDATANKGSCYFSGVFDIRVYRLDPMVISGVVQELDLIS